MAFLRTLVERKLIPDDVEVQVLVQCREHLIKRTFEALEGVKKAIVHIYNSTSTLQRDVVFHKDREDIKDIAVIGTKMVQRYMADCDTQIRLEYSPESFTGTELDFALDICTAVQETWGATRENPIIINLPSTVEMTTPNVYAGKSYAFSAGSSRWNQEARGWLAVRWSWQVEERTWSDTVLDILRITRRVFFQSWMWPRT